MYSWKMYQKRIIENNLFILEKKQEKKENGEGSSFSFLVKLRKPGPLVF